MTISRAAKAATTRKNNKIIREYPLLVPALQDWFTTPEAEQERLDRQHRQAEIYLEKLERHYILRIKRGQIIRSWGLRILPTEIAQKVDRTAGACPADYMAGLFSNALADYLGFTRIDMWEMWKGFIPRYDDDRDQASI